MRTLFVIFTISLLVTCVASAVDLDSSAVLYMPFEEGRGDEATDLSGNGNDGKFNGDIKWADGQFGGALEFNGKDTFVEVASNPMLQAGEDGWSIALWVWADPTSGGWARFVDKYFGTGYIIGRRDSDLVAGAEWAGSPNSFATTTTVFDKKWHHFVYTRELNGGNNVHKLYLDGELENEGGGGAIAQKNQDTTPVRIGAGDECCEEGGAVSYFLKGMLDEVIIYRKALSEGEINDLMNEGINLAVQPLSKLTTTWAKIKTNNRN